MLYTPHAVTGATIGYLIPNPFIAIPLSIVSHLFFDVVPHSNPNPLKAKKGTLIIIFLEILVGHITLFYLAYLGSQNYSNPAVFYNMLFSGMGANLPDYMTFPIAILKRDILYSKKISEFQSLIQNHVKPLVGYPFQVIFTTVMLFLLVSNLN